MAYNVKTDSLTKEGGKTKKILLFNDSCKKGDMVVSVNNVFKLMNDVIFGDIYNGIVGKVEEDSENASTKPVLVTLFDDTMTVNVAVENTETGEVVEATVQGNVLQDIVEETIEDIEEDKSYAYRFLNYDGTVLQQGRAMKGTAPTYTGSTPTRESSVSTDYTFSGRQPAITAFDTDTDLVAQYSETTRMYWVTFENYDGTTLQSTKVAYGETPSYVGETPTNPAGVFDGWTPEIAPVTGDATYMAVFIVHSYQEAPEVDEMTLMEAIKADNPDISPMMIEGVKKVTSRLNVIISTEYLAGGEARNFSTDEDGMVFIQTNANSELVAYVFRTREELGANYNTYRDAFMNPANNMTDEIWDAIQGFFINTIHVVSSQGITTIDLNGSNSITVDESTHAMRYNAEYYVETNNTSTEYSTLDSKGWLIQGEYIITDADVSVYNSIVSSIKTKGIANASIQHDISNGEITISNGGYSITIQDKNIGATEYLGKTAGNDSLAYGDFYCWGGKNPFITLPTNEKEEDWSVMQTPAPNGYHIPTLAEMKALIKFMKVIRPTHYKEQFVSALLMPRAGRRNPLSGSIEYQGTNCNCWTSSVVDNEWSSDFTATADEVSTYQAIVSGGKTLRCFKDSFTFNDIDSNLGSFSSVDDAVNRLKGTVNSAGILKNFCINNGSDVGGVYSYTSPTSGIVYEWDKQNVTIQSSSFGKILRNNSDGWYQK